MLTDDPDTVPDGHWEINFSGILATASDRTLIQFPYVDANYGWGERAQLKAESGWAIESEGIASTRNGAETLLVGVKYRFLDEEKAGVAVSTYPQFQFHHFFSATSPAINLPGNLYILPIEFLKTLGNWAINPEIGYIYGTESPDQVFISCVLAFEKTRPWQPMAEVHVNTGFDGSGTTTLLNFGLIYTLSPLINLFGALGHTVTHPEDAGLELDANLGLQLVL